MSPFVSQIQVSVAPLSRQIWVPKGGLRQCASCSVPRRPLVLSLLFPLLSPPISSALSAPPAEVHPELAPDTTSYDPADPQLRAAARLIEDALNAPDLPTEEQMWTEIIEKYSDVDAPWVPDVVGRAWGNRGNARSRQGRMTEAVKDFNKAIEICPWSVDPVLNRGVVLESIGQFDDAIRDYKALLQAAPDDPAGKLFSCSIYSTSMLPSVWNNLGNAYAGKSEWSTAAEYYDKASVLAPEFVFARANKAVVLYQAGGLLQLIKRWVSISALLIGKEEEALRTVRNLLRKYPDFTDMRAALTSILWNEGNEGEAESEWARVRDPRYADKVWLVEERRWPPKLVAGLTDFLELRSVPR